MQATVRQVEMNLDNLNPEAKTFDELEGLRLDLIRRQSSQWCRIGRRKPPGLTKHRRAKLESKADEEPKRFAGGGVNGGTGT